MNHIPNAIAMLGLSIGEIFKIQEILRRERAS